MDTKLIMWTSKDKWVDHYCSKKEINLNCHSCYLEMTNNNQWFCSDDCRKKYFYKKRNKGVGKPGSSSKHIYNFTYNEWVAYEKFLFSDKAKFLSVDDNPLPINNIKKHKKYPILKTKKHVLKKIALIIGHHYQFKNDYDPRDKKLLTSYEKNKLKALLDIYNDSELAENTGLSVDFFANKRWKFKYNKRYKIKVPVYCWEAIKPALKRILPGNQLISDINNKIYIETKSIEKYKLKIKECESKITRLKSINNDIDSGRQFIGDAVTSYLSKLDKIKINQLKKYLEMELTDVN